MTSSDGRLKYAGLNKRHDGREVTLERVVGCVPVAVEGGNISRSFCCFLSCFERVADDAEAEGEQRRAVCICETRPEVDK